MHSHCTLNLLPKCVPTCIYTTSDGNLVYTCNYACVFACVHLCVRVHVRPHACVRVCVCVDECVHACVFVHVDARTCMCMSNIRCIHCPLNEVEFFCDLFGCLQSHLKPGQDYSRTHNKVHTLYTGQYRATPDYMHMHIHVYTLGT